MPAVYVAFTVCYRLLSDVSSSRHYNRIVDAQVAGAAAVKGSSEPMRRDLHFHGDQRYRLGFVIEDNAQAVPKAGSCIFAHLWDGPTDATVGCTAMVPPVMRSLLAWLQPAEKPVFVLLPYRAYSACKRYGSCRGYARLPAPTRSD